MGEHEQDSKGNGMRRLFLLVCGAALLAVTGGGLGGYVAGALAGPDRETVAAEADANEALRQEREKSQQLERQLAGSLKHIAAQADLVAQAVSQAEELADLRKALEAERTRSETAALGAEQLQEERQKAEGLDRDLASARKEIEERAAAVVRAGEQASEARKTAERTATELRGQIAEAGTRVESLTRDLAVARQEIEERSAAVARAGEQASEARKTAERTAAELRGQVAEAGARAESLTRDLAAARHENQTLATALEGAAAKSADAPQLEELQHALRQSEAQRQALAQALQAQAAAAPPKPQLVSVETVAVRQAPAAAAPAGPATPETIRLMARAQQLVEQRNISGARQILERVVESGHPPALFALAETYDPNVLAAWGTVGTQGDAGRARALYGKALAGGVAEADARLKGLP